jgi:hypothetical protein
MAAKMFDFPSRNEWSGAAKRVAEKMKQEGFGDEAIETVSARLRAYREKYLTLGFDVDIVGLNLSPEAIEKIEAVFRKIEEQLHRLTGNVLLERISTEIALLALDHEGYIRE